MLGPADSVQGTPRLQESDCTDLKPENLYRLGSSYRFVKTGDLGGIFRLGPFRDFQHPNFASTPEDTQFWVFDDRSLVDYE